MTEPPALIAGRYRIVRLVGSGGMGAVWEAWDERLERRVALKLLHRPSGVSSTEADLASIRATREARITARLYHPHAVQVYDVIDHEGQPCLIMQFIPSITLAAVLAEGGPLRPDEAAHVGAQIGSALAAAHAVGIVHRDVKPGNILIAEDGNALISDFGIARALGDATLTTSGMVHGTPAYLAPEVAQGSEANFASDVFSLGSTLYGAMEGAPPFGADQNSIALLHRVAAGEVPPPQRCGALTPIVMQMLSADPTARPSMRKAADHLAELAGHGGSDAMAKTLALPTTVQEAPGQTAESADLSPTPETRHLAVSKTASESADLSPTPETRHLAVSKIASTPAGGTAPQIPAPEHEPPARRGRGVAAAAAIIALVGIGILLAVVLPEDRRGADPPVGSAQSSTAAPATTSRTSPTASATTSPRRESSLTAKPRTSTRPPSLVPTASKEPTVAGAATAAELQRAITSYYALMPRNTDAGWPRMTSSYQTNHAGGRTGYQRFWDAVDRISVVDVTGDPPNSAQATITYYFKDGRVVRERTAYGLVNEGGRLKINSSTVLSSTAV